MGKGDFTNVLISGTRRSFQMIAPVRLTTYVSWMEIKVFLRDGIEEACFKGAFQRTKFFA